MSCEGVRRLSEALAVVALNGRSESEARRSRELCRRIHGSDIASCRFYVKLACSNK